MQYLRQSTASQEVIVGPFLDSTDGNTAETALSIANTDIKIWKTGGTTESSKNSGGATHIASGRYYTVLDATDTNTIGPLEINVHVSGALPVKLRCCVLDEAVYDVLFGTTAPSTLAAGALMGLADNAITAAKIASDAITAAKIADGAITETKISAGALDNKGNWNVGKTGYSLTQSFPTNFDSLAIDGDGFVNVANNYDKTGYSLSVAPLDAAGVRAAVGLASANLDTQLANLPTVAEFEARTIVAANYATASNLAVVAEYLDTEIAAILENTGTTIPAQISALSIPAASTVAFAVRTELGTELGRLDVAVSTRGTGANQSTIITHLTDIKGATFSGSTDSLEAIRDRGDSAWATATAVTVSDKTGFKLASDGLDSIATTAPSGVASNFREMIVQVWRYFFKKTTKDDNSNNIKTYADNGSTVLTTQTTSDTGGVQTRGAAS